MITLPALQPHTDLQYPGYNLRISDQTRINEWEREFKQFVAGNSLPTVELVRLPNDHTSGTTPGARTPKAFVADNDLALGRLVEAVSHSQFWRSTAIFVVEDDAQNGPDHVDAHRTEALVISPYSRLGRVDSTFYSIEPVENLAPRDADDFQSCDDSTWTGRAAAGRSPLPATTRPRRGSAQPLL